MPSPAIPERQPIHDRVTAALSQVGADVLLAAAAIPAGQTLLAGELLLRYGIPYLGRPFDSLVPDLVVADYGDMLVGEAAWTFLMERGHLHPRADVLGHRADGQDEMVVLKHLDPALPFDVFAYRQAADRQPLARVSALIAAEPTDFPARLLKHLPIYDSFDDWRARNG